MDSVQQTEFGKPRDVLKLVKNLPLPEIGELQILIRVHNAGVNPLDCYITKGDFGPNYKMPYTPGSDVAGVIVKLGSKVASHELFKHFNIGDRVYSSMAHGAYSTHTLVDAEKTFKMPDNFSFAQGACLGLPYFTVLRCLLIKCNAKPGQSVLIHGASGGVGIAALQIGQALGLHVVGTAGSEAGLQLVRDNKAQAVFNHKDKDYVEKIKAQYPNGFDIILEMLANHNLNTDLDLANMQGTIVIIGSRGDISITPMKAMAKEVNMCGVLLLVQKTEEWQKCGNKLNELITKGLIKPVVGQEYPLCEAASAQVDQIEMSYGQSSGKRILKC